MLNLGIPSHQFEAKHFSTESDVAMLALTLAGLSWQTKLLLARCVAKKGIVLSERSPAMEVLVREGFVFVREVWALRMLLVVLPTVSGEEATHELFRKSAVKTRRLDKLYSEVCG